MMKIQLEISSTPESRNTSMTMSFSKQEQVIVAQIENSVIYFDPAYIDDIQEFLDSVRPLVKI